MEGSSIERRGGVFIVLKEMGCDATVRVFGFGVLGFKAVLDFTGAAFRGAAGTR